jgi:hypothetical protein
MLVSRIVPLMALALASLATACSAASGSGSEATANAISTEDALRGTEYITLAKVGGVATSALGTKKKVAALLAAIQVGEELAGSEPAPECPADFVLEFMSGAGSLGFTQVSACPTLKLPDGSRHRLSMDSAAVDAVLKSPAVVGDVLFGITRVEVTHADGREPTDLDVNVAMGSLDLDQPPGWGVEAMCGEAQTTISFFQGERLLGKLEAGNPCTPALAQLTVAYGKGLVSYTPPPTKP